jgi:GTP diphosphokinase / guanosine-3',5'-bis(diphosphate) 3'-diphosphatase
MQKALAIQRCYVPFVESIEEGVGLILKAAGFAAEKHRRQTRKDPEASPYINHPISVATVLWHEADIRDLTAIASALLHDTVEDTDATIEELTREFGATIASVVGEVSDDKSLPKEARKRAQVDHAPHLSLAAQRVKIADKICNLRDVARIPPPDWPLQRRQAYFDWAVEVISQMPQDHGRLTELFAEVSKLRP